MNDINDKNINEAGDNYISETNDKMLMSVPVDLLYDGMVIQDDIYDSSGSRLLISSGNTLSEIQIERIKRMNSGAYNIYVTGRTHRSMISKRPDIEIESRQDVEESTGYAKSNNETFKLLEEIAGSKTVNTESLQVVSSELSDRLAETPPTTILSLINAMAPVSEYLQRHSVNVSLLNGLIGRWMGASEKEVDDLVLIGLLHDCGKTLIPPKILNAPRKLTTVEYEVAKMHVNYTYDLLADFPEYIRIAASSHHERTNGTGYAKKLSIDNIMLAARITAVSDTYDAIVSSRAFQKPQSPFFTLALLEKLSENEFDKTVVSIFTKNMPGELMNKPVMMSDGTIGVVREFDPDDIEYPMVELSGHTVKSNESLYISNMFSDD